MNKKNVDALKNILSGKEAEKSISVGYTAKAKEFGDEYEQRNGYKVKKTRFDDIRVPMFCPKCESVMKGRRDTEAYYSHGTCLDCMVDYHDELRKEGKLQEYTFRKQLLNARSWLADNKQQLKEFEEKGKLDGEYVLADGTIEKWTSDVKIEDVVNSYKEYLDKFEQDLNKSITDYEQKYNKSLDDK